MWTQRLFLTGAGLSLYRGDWIGAGLSLISVVPYAGDALGKTAKGARLARKIAALKKRIEASIAAVKAAKVARFAAKRAATARLRAKRAADQAKKIADAEKCQPCRPPAGNRFGSKSPAEGSNGSWRGGERGNSTWHPDRNTPKGRAVLGATGGRPVKFKNGYPNFSPYAKHRVGIDMKGTDADFTAARDAVRTKLNDPNWETPKGWTWHHNEDGVTMELVPTNLNNNIPHTGGDSLSRELLNDPTY